MTTRSRADWYLTFEERLAGVGIRLNFRDLVLKKVETADFFNFFHFNCGTG